MLLQVKNESDFTAWGSIKVSWLGRPSENWIKSLDFGFPKSRLFNIRMTFNHLNNGLVWNSYGYYQTHKKTAPFVFDLTAINKLFSKHCEAVICNFSTHQHNSFWLCLGRQDSENVVEWVDQKSNLGIVYNSGHGNLKSKNVLLQISFGLSKRGRGIP